MMTQVLEPDIYRRDPLPSLQGPRRRAHDGLVFGIFMVASLGLVVASKFEPQGLALARAHVQDLAQPLFRATAVAVRPLLGISRMLAEWNVIAEERNKLRDENEKLKGWEARAHALQRQVGALSELTRVVEEAQLSIATVRVITGVSGPFVRAAVIDAGRDSGLKPGFPVMAAQGLAGRIVASGERSSRLLLVTDYNSRIPVVIGADSARGVMQGDNGPLPRIAYLPPDARIKPGDDVYTSGVGGIFPRGLRVGTVVETGEGFRIEPSARLERLDYVSVLFSESLSALLADEERAIEARANARRLSPSALPGSKGSTP